MLNVWVNVQVASVKAFHFGLKKKKNVYLYVYVHTVSVCLGCSNKIPQTRCLKQHCSGGWEIKELSRYISFWGLLLTHRWLPSSWVPRWPLLFLPLLSQMSYKDRKVLPLWQHLTCTASQRHQLQMLLSYWELGLQHMHLAGDGEEKAQIFSPSYPPSGLQNSCPHM